jgi:hypothetical protein
VAYYISHEITLHILSIYVSLTYKYIDLHVFIPRSTTSSMTMTNLSLDPLTWIIYQGHLSTRCPPSPSHDSTKHVLKSPTYHRKICTCTIPCTNLYHASTIHINTYTIPCANHENQKHMYHIMFQPCTSTMYIKSYHDLYQNKCIP